MQDHRVVITGAGPLSAIGIGREAFFAGLRAGATGIAPITAFPADKYRSRQAAEIRDFAVEDYLESQKTYLDRTSQFAFAALSLALEDANLDPGTADRSAIALLTGTAMGCLDTCGLFLADLLEKGPRLVKPLLFPHTYSNTPISLLAIEYGLSGPHLSFSSGATSAACAILAGYDLVRQGRAKIALAGGFDALSEYLLAGFDLAGTLSPRDGGPERCAPFDAARNGTVLGEGAGILVLEGAEHAAARGATALAEIVGAGITGDSSADQTGDGNGAGILEAMQLALDAGGRERLVPDCVLASANGSPGLDRNEARAIANLLGLRVRDIPVTSIKPMVGETLGASGALQVIAALGVLLTGFVPPTLNLRATDGEPELNVPRDEGQEMEVGTVLVNTIDPGGGVVSFAMARHE